MTVLACPGFKRARHSGQCTDIGLASIIHDPCNMHGFSALKDTKTGKFHRAKDVSAQCDNYLILGQSDAISSCNGLIHMKYWP